MSARDTRGKPDYNRIIEQNPYVRDGSPIVLIPKTPRSTQRDFDMQLTQRRRLLPSATPGINVIRDIDQDPARLLVFVVSGFILRHLLRCGRCHFTQQVLTSHARAMLWQFAGVHIHHQDLGGLIFRLEHATQTLGFNVAAVIPFDRRFCALLRSTRGFLLDPPKPGFEAFHQGGTTWPDLYRRWEELSNDIAASGDGRQFNVAALNEALDSRLHGCHYSRLPPPLVDAPTFSGYRQTPPLQDEVDLPVETRAQSNVHAIPTPPSTSEDPEPSLKSTRRRQPSRPARRRAQSAMARAAVAEADLTEREDSEDRRLVEEDEAVSSIEKSPQKSRHTMKRKRDDDRRPRAAASSGQESHARPSGSNNPPKSPSQGFEDQKLPRKRFKNKGRRNFYVPTPEPPSRFVPNYDPTPSPEPPESEPRPEDVTTKVEPEHSLPERPRSRGSEAVFAEANSDAEVIAELTREFAANLGGDEYPENTVSVIEDQFGFRTRGRDPPELETVEELVHATLREYEAQRRAEAEARQVQAQIRAEAVAAEIQARQKEEEAKAKAEREAMEKAMAEGGAAARAKVAEREKRRRALLEVPATRAIREAKARLEERRRQETVANRALMAQEDAERRAEAQKQAAEKEKKRAADAKAQAEAAKAAIASHAAVLQQTPSDSDCCNCDSDAGGSVSDDSASNDSSSGDSAFDETSSDETSSDKTSVGGPSIGAASSGEASGEESSSEESSSEESSSGEASSEESFSEESSNEESSSDETASVTSTPELTRIVLRMNHGTFDREVLQMRLKLTQSGVQQDLNLLEELTRCEQRRR